MLRSVHLCMHIARDMISEIIHVLWLFEIIVFAK